jgi:hypothetical protein
MFRKCITVGLKMLNYVTQTAVCLYWAEDGALRITLASVLYTCRALVSLSSVLQIS